MSTSAHSLCEEDFSKDSLAKLNKRSAIEHLHIMKNQGLFALDAHELVENTIDRIDYVMKHLEKKQEALYSLYLKNTKGISGDPLQPNIVHSVGTQTEDYGCNNGCTSMYIDRDVNLNENEHLVQEEVGLEIEEERTSNEDGIARRDEYMYVETEACIKTEDNNTNNTTLTTFQRNVAEDYDFNDVKCTLTGDSHNQELEAVLSEHPEFREAWLNVEGAIQNSDSPTSVSCDTMIVNVSDACQEVSKNEESRKIQKNMIDDEVLADTTVVKNTVNSDEYGIRDETVMLDQRKQHHCSPTVAEDEVLMNVDQCSHGLDISPTNNEAEDLSNGSTCVYDDTAEKTNKTPESIHTSVKQYKCAFCNKVFAHKGNCKSHERIHTGVKPYTCKHCNKAFTQRGSLEAHERIHTGVKPYKCKHCNKAFTQRGSLEAHERIHTGVKPYKCKHCNGAFAVKCNVEEHERIHTGVKPYKCKHCNKAFARQSHLEAHERIHTGVKPYKCKHCNKAFTVKRSLEKYERVHTSVKSYKCEHCNKTFTHQDHLKIHIRTCVKP